MLQNRIVVITGAAGGIGSETARVLAEGGATVVITDIDQNALSQLQGRLRAMDARVLAIQHDVTRADSWQWVVQRVIKTFGRVDVLINNAGIVQPGWLERISLSKIQQQIRVNFLGTILGCQAVLLQMKKQKSGHIINVASLGGIVPMPGEAVYCGTKYAIRGFSLSLRAELKDDGIRVSVISPDSVETAQLAYETRFEEAILSFVSPPLKPQDVASAVLKALKHPRAEILMPGVSGSIIRFCMAVPSLFFWIYPYLKKFGSRNRAVRLADNP